MADPNNPYSAPSADEDAPLARDYAGDMVDASPGLRFVHLLVDYIAFLLLAALCGVLGGALGIQLTPLIVYPLLIGFYVFFEGIFSATPGKMLTRTRVVSLDGSKPSFGQIFGRTLVRFVPFEAFSFLGSGSGWHDRWPKTRVVRRG
jgi:uncharacterized RDD family membrane protein YckC